MKTTKIFVARRLDTSRHPFAVIDSMTASSLSEARAWIASGPEGTYGIEDTDGVSYAIEDHDERGAAAAE